MNDLTRDLKCGYAEFAGISEWTCASRADYVIVGVSGSGYYETEMPRCARHLKPTLMGINPPNTEYPYYSLRRVEWLWEKEDE